MKQRKIYWLGHQGKRHFETITDIQNFRKELDDVCEKAKRENLAGYAKSEIV